MSINEIPIWAKVLCYALLLTFAITIVFPFMWMVFTSFKSMEDYTNKHYTEQDLVYIRSLRWTDWTILSNAIIKEAGLHHMEYIDKRLVHMGMSSLISHSLKSMIETIGVDLSIKEKQMCNQRFSQFEIPLIVKKVTDRDKIVFDSQEDMVKKVVNSINQTDGKNDIYMGISRDYAFNENKNNIKSLSSALNMGIRLDNCFCSSENIGLIFLSFVFKNFFKILSIFLEFFSISSSLKIFRVLSLPDGSPILVVPPPNNTIGWCPCFWSIRKHIICRRLPTCKLSAVQSKPM